MAAKYCEPCTARGMTPTALQWCTECEEALCPECAEVHKVQKVSRSHHLVEISKIPKKMNISYNCSKHQHLPFDYFCVDHGVICCKECLPKDHRVCKNITSIDIASKSSKQSQSFLDYEDQLRFISEALGNLNINRKENCSRIEQEETQIRKQIAKAKENVIKRLESLEKSLLKQVTEMKDKDITGIQRQQKDINDMVTCTNVQKEALEFIKDHGSEKQAFVSIHSSKPILNDIENKVKQLIESIVETSLMFVERISKDNLTDLGSIELKETPCSVLMVPLKQLQSQVPVLSSGKITSITYINDIDMKKERLKILSGMAISDNSTLIFCDVTLKKVYFCDENDTYQSSIMFPYTPWDIAAIPGTSTAVISCKFISNILFININKRKISKQVEVKQSECRGVDATKHNIYVGSKGHIYVLDLHGNFEKAISVTTKKQFVNYISVCSNGNICYSTDNEVHCITSNGKPVFSYNSPDLRKARAIQIDDVDNLYVLGGESQNIHILTSSGTLIDVLAIDNLSEPFSFSLNNEQSKVYIANNRGETISVFKAKK